MTGRQRQGHRFLQAALAFPSASIFDATSRGRYVRFLVDPAPGGVDRPRRMVFHANSNADAQLIFDALPARMSANQARERDEEEAFAEQLARATPRAVVTPILVAINLLIFLAMLVDGAGLVTAQPATHIRWGSNYGPLTAAGEWWRLATNMFMHFGVLHVFLNMWALHETGRLTERLFGHARFLAVYLLAGIAGSLASLGWNPQVNSAGASGAIFGVIGALLAYLLDRRNGVPSSVMRRHRLPLLAFITCALAYGLSHGNIDNAAHLGGLATGILTGLAWPLALERTRGIATTRRFISALAMFSVVMAGSAVVVLRRADGINEEMRFRDAVARLAVTDRTLSTLAQEALDGLQQGQLSRAQAAGHLSDLASTWSRMNGELASVRLPSHSALNDLRRQLIHLSELRSQGLGELASGIAEADAQRIREAFGPLVESKRLERSLQRALADALRPH